MNDLHAAHLDDLAELYALGALPEIERAAADAHIAQCPQCRQRVGEAEETVAALITAQPVRPQLDRRIHASFARRQVPRYLYGVIAAALIVGLLPFAFWQHAQVAGTPQEAALAAMVHSHFLHAPFQKLAPGAPAAKVIYARTGAWLYVIASTEKNLTVSANGRALGSLSGNGSERTLFVAHPVLAKTIELMDGPRTVARAAVGR